MEFTSAPSFFLLLDTKPCYLDEKLLHGRFAGSPLSAIAPALSNSDLIIICGAEVNLYMT